MNVNALSLGSNLESRLRLFNAAGNEIAANAVPGADPSLTYEVATSGTYYIGVSGTENGAYDPNVPQSGLDGSVGLPVAGGGEVAGSESHLGDGESGRFHP